jgi:hypothetical protein
VNQILFKNNKLISIFTLCRCVRLSFVFTAIKGRWAVRQYHQIEFEIYVAFRVEDLSGSLKTKAALYTEILQNTIGSHDK